MWGRFLPPDQRRNPCPLSSSAPALGFRRKITLYYWAKILQRLGSGTHSRPLHVLAGLSPPGILRLFRWGLEGINHHPRGGRRLRGWGNDLRAESCGPPVVGRSAFSVLVISSAADISNTSASFSSTTIFGLCIPLSTIEMKDLSKPAMVASCSWERDFSFLASRNTLPKAHLGPVVGWSWACFGGDFCLAKSTSCGVHSF